MALGQLDLVGQRFGLLFVLAKVVNDRGIMYWKCECDCGVVRDYTLRRIEQFNIQSCGCLDNQPPEPKVVKPSRTGEPEYTIWRSIVQKCTQPKMNGWANCGARGITVCVEWSHSYENFINDMGRRPGRHYRLTRRNPNRGFDKENCFWRRNKNQHLEPDE
jgi:hypothetical protein